MDSLPYELLDAIVDRVPDRMDLGQIRMLNKTFRAVATPHVFRQVTVKSILPSALRFGEVLRSDVAQFIETIVFKELSTHMLPQYREDAVSHAEALMETLSPSFAHIHNLPRLKFLKLHFFTTPHAQSTCHHWTVISASLSQSPLPSLHSLTIHSLTPWESVQIRPSFRSLFGSLVGSPCVEIAEVEPHFGNPHVDLWEHMFGFPLSSLTSLTLHSKADVRVVPGLDFSQADFAALEFLSLQRILFNQNTHIEDFIVRHKGTLKKLHLKECRIAIVDEGIGAPRQWSHIWTRFSGELRAMVLLVVQPQSRYEQPGHKFVDYGRPLNYVWPHVETGNWYKPIVMPLPYDVGDEQALTELRRTVHSQAAEHGYTD